MTFFSLAVLAGAPPTVAGSELEDSFADRELAHWRSLVRGGLIVHLGCGDGRRTAELRFGDNCLVHGLDADPAQVAEARQHLQSEGLYGPVSITRLHGDRLPYVDNLVNLLVADELGTIGISEVMRVIAPGGVAAIRDSDGWKTHVKQRPEEFDDWTHYLRAPDNNAVSSDKAVGPPRHMQWLAEPEWTRNHHTLASVSSVVTAGGRLFALVDEAPAANIHLPGNWSIVARDAFSGVTLWKKPLQSWAWHRIRFRSGPPQLARLMVASGDLLYTPLELCGPICQIDAATGETLKTFDATAGAEELLVDRGVLLVLIGSPVGEQATGHPVFRDRYRFPNEKRVVAVDPRSGKLLWQWHDPELVPMPETLATDGADRVFLQVNEAVTCLDRRTGELLWISGKTEADEEHQIRNDQNLTDYKTFLQSDRSDAFSMAEGAVSDVLVSDGTNAFLHHVKFDAALEKRDELSRHLFSTSSLLDDAENHRSHWVLGSGDFSRVPVAYSWVVNRPGSRMPTIAVPTGLMMVFDEQAVWGVRRRGNSDGRYRLFKMANRPFDAGEAAPPDFRKIPKEQVQRNLWQHDLPVRTAAMLKSGDQLYLGTSPVEIPVNDPYAAYEGRLGGAVWVCSAADGGKRAELPLKSPPVWDGMAVAGEKLFLAAADGSVVCFSSAIDFSSAAEE